VRAHENDNEQRNVAYIREITGSLRSTATVGRDKTAISATALFSGGRVKARTRVCVCIRRILYRTFSPHVERRRTFKMKQSFKNGFVEFRGRPSGNLPNSYTPVKKKIQWFS